MSTKLPTIPPNSPDSLVDNHHPSPPSTCNRKPSFISKLKESVAASRTKSSSTTTTTTPLSPQLLHNPPPLNDLQGNANAEFLSHAHQSDLAPSHGDASPPPTMERRSSFKEVYQSLKSRTLSLGSRSKSNGSDTDQQQSAVKPNNSTFAIKYGTLDKQCIGKGATAVVRLVHKHTESGENNVFAVKEFRRKRKNENEREYIKKLTSEFCISSSLMHINIVRTIDLIQDENLHWCEVMEYCSGGDLYSVIKTGKMSRDEMDCCFKQLIHGVHYLHSNGVAHRDIKPENLLLDNKGRLKITDFGVSEVFKVCWEREPHLSKGVCGSEPYIAPEEFNGAEYDAREVDIWACGIVYYAMVYSGIPWRQATSDDPNFEHFLKYRTRDFEAIDRLPDGCRELIYKILEPNPKLRVTASDILADPWFISIEACFECREYGDVDLPEGIECQTRILCKHFHHVSPVSVQVPQSSGTLKNTTAQVPIPTPPTPVTSVLPESPKMSSSLPKQVLQGPAGSINQRRKISFSSSSLSLPGISSLSTSPPVLPMHMPSTQLSPILDSVFCLDPCTTQDPPLLPPPPQQQQPSSSSPPSLVRAEVTALLSVNSAILSSCPDLLGPTKLHGHHGLGNSNKHLSSCPSALAQGTKHLHSKHSRAPNQHHHHPPTSPISATRYPSSLGRIEAAFRDLMHIH